MERNFDHLTHLTDEQFSDLLLGTNPSSVQQHLKTCSACAEEADRVAGAIGSFDRQTRLWAERRAATLPILVPSRPSSLAWMVRPQAWTAVALTIVFAAAVGISGNNHHPSPAPAQIAQSQPSAEVSPSTLKADNDLLSAIDGELRADDSSADSSYGLNTAAHGVRTRSAKRTISE
jgi:hypothetical protein